MAQKKWSTITVRPNKKVKVDHEDLTRISAHSWRVTKGTTGRLRVVTSIRGPNGSRQITLGKFLMKPPKGKQVYPRRFNDGLDYRKDNLIVCTLKERQRLLPKKRSESTSSYRGVSYSQTSKKWRAGIEIDGVSMNLGEYKTEAAAAQAYNKAAAKYFGKNAYQNEIRKNPHKRNRG
ncbi:MAG: AP2 domain-containing protein [Bdellovibrionota bacterium]